MSDRLRQEDAPGSVDPADVEGPGSSLDERLRAVERALTGTDRELTEIETAAERADRLDDLEERLASVEKQVADLEAAVQAVRGYVGAIRAVNRDVERRADAALAAARSGDPEPGSDPDSPARRGRPDGTETLREAGGADGDRAAADAPPDRSIEPADDGTDPAPGTVTGDETSSGDLPADEGTRDWPWEADPDDVSPTDHGFEPVETAGSGDGADDEGTGSSDPPGGDGGDRPPEDRRAGDRSAGNRPAGDGWDRQDDSGTSPAAGARSPDDVRRGRSPRGSRGDPDRTTDDPGHGGEHAGESDRSGDPTRRDPDSAGSRGADGGTRTADAGEPGSSRRSRSDRSRGRSTAGGEGEFEWPPGDGLDVDRAQPWSAPDLPPADAPEEERSLLDRLREAL